jgi:hypothetical protein
MEIGGKVCYNPRGTLTLLDVIITYTSLINHAD